MFILILSGTDEAISKSREDSRAQLGLSAVKAVTSVGASAGPTAAFVEKNGGMFAIDVMMHFRKVTGGAKITRKRHMEIWKDWLQSYEPSLNPTDRSSIFAKTLMVLDHGASVTAASEKTFSTDACYVLPTISTPGDLTKKMITNFRVVDVDGDHLITSQDLAEFLAFYLQGASRFTLDFLVNSEKYNVKADLSEARANIPHVKYLFRPEQIDEMVKRAFKEADTDKGGYITHHEWLDWTVEGNFKETWGALAELMM